MAVEDARFARVINPTAFGSPLGLLGSKVAALQKRRAQVASWAWRVRKELHPHHLFLSFHVFNANMGSPGATLRRVVD